MPEYYTFILLLFILVLFILLAVNIHLRHIRLKIQKTPDHEKSERLNSLLLPYGFQYDSAADYFYSTMHCWQRKYGYHRLYDSSAAALSMIFDCEPIYFDYGQRHWLIEFWKGQYGISAGAEVGIYAIDSDGSPLQEPQQKHYKSIDDSELFPVRISLYHERTLIAVRDRQHWWLTAFFLGRFYPPHTLTAKISISFPDYDMCNAYIEGLKHAGYASSDISRCLLTVTVPFTVPKTEQPAPQRSLSAHLRLRINRFNCFLYRHITRDYKTTLDKLEFLALLSPVLLHIALHFTKTQKRYNRSRTAKETSHVHRKPAE